MFNDHRIRTKVNYQFTRSLSFRTIVDYNGILPDAKLVDLQKRKRVTTDFLATYLVHPGTAVYVGYGELYEGWGRERTDGRFGPAARQFFVKVSYLIRF